MAAIVNRMIGIQSAIYVETDRRLREWGGQCGPVLEDSRRPYRDTAIKEMVDVGNRFRRDRTLRKDRRDRRRASAVKAAELRKARRENRVSICSACGHLHFGECKRCKGDPRYTALGKQTRSFAPRAEPVARVTAAAAEIDVIVAHLVAWQREVLHRRYLFDQPARISAKELFISHTEFELRVAAAIEQVTDMLATRNDSRI
jgi:hypothetical protein